MTEVQQIETEVSRVKAEMAQLTEDLTKCGAEKIAASQSGVKSVTAGNALRAWAKGAIEKLKTYVDDSVVIVKPIYSEPQEIEEVKET